MSKFSCLCSPDDQPLLVQVIIEGHFTGGLPACSKCSQKQHETTWNNMKQHETTKYFVSSDFVHDFDADAERWAIFGGCFVTELFFGLGWYHWMPGQMVTKAHFMEAGECKTSNGVVLRSTWFTKAADDCFETDGKKKQIFNEQHKQPTKTGTLKLHIIRPIFCRIQRPIFLQISDPLEVAMPLGATMPGVPVVEVSVFRIFPRCKHKPSS